MARDAEKGRAKRELFPRLVWEKCCSCAGEAPIGLAFVWLVCFIVICEFGRKWDNCVTELIHTIGYLMKNEEKAIKLRLLVKIAVANICISVIMMCAMVVLAVCICVSWHNDCPILSRKRLNAYFYSCLVVAFVGIFLFVMWFLLFSLSLSLLASCLMTHNTCVQALKHLMIEGSEMEGEGEPTQVQLGNIWFRMPRILNEPLGSLWPYPQLPDLGSNPFPIGPDFPFIPEMPKVKQCYEFNNLDIFKLGKVDPVQRLKLCGRRKVEQFCRKHISPLRWVFRGPSITSGIAVACFAFILMYVGAQFIHIRWLVYATRVCLENETTNPPAKETAAGGEPLGTSR